jgi:hypothetical protein
MCAQPANARQFGAPGRAAVAVSVNLFIALLYLSPLPDRLRGGPFVFFHSYFSDIVLPFCMYLLTWMAAARVRLLRGWWVRGLLVFGVASFAEVLQLFGVPLLGRTFDPLDFVMYAGGVLLAVLADRLLLERWFPAHS